MPPLCQVKCQPGQINFSMFFFDGCVFPFPGGDVSLSRFGLELRKLGFSGFVAAGTDNRSNNSQYTNNCQYISQNMKIWSARYLTGLSSQNLVKETGKPLRDNELIYVSAQDSGYNRTVLSMSGVHALMDLHKTPKGGFDRFCARIAGDRGVAIGLSLRPLVELRGVNRQKVIRKYEEIFILHQRYEFPLLFSSHAQELTHLRSARSMMMLIRTIWGDEKVLNSGFSAIPSLRTGSNMVMEV